MVKAIADGILIWNDGETIEEATANHDERPLTLLERCKRNIKLGKEKFQLRKTELSYMGVVLTDKGVKTDSKKQDCIRSMPATTNKDEVRRLLSVVTYLSRFSCQPSQNRYEHCSKKKPRSSEKQMNRKLLKKLRPSSQTHHY